MMGHACNENLTKIQTERRKWDGFWFVPSSLERRVAWRLNLRGWVHGAGWEMEQCLYILDIAEKAEPEEYLACSKID
jgi:hypothetical protein